MKEIPLSNSTKVALVSDKDYERVMELRWYTFNAGTTASPLYYAVSSRFHNLLMHRFILGAQPGQQIDHIDRNGLNNQRSNIWLCTVSENNRNRAPYMKPRAVGAYFNKKSKQWHSQLRITENGVTRSIYVGSFNTKASATKAFQEVRAQYKTTLTPQLQRPIT